MPAELPGFYFDAEKNRYFKIQANHIAPSGSKYSRQAVKAEKVIKKAQQWDEMLQQSKLAETVTRSKLLRNPLLVFDRQLGHLRKSAGALVEEYYAAALTGKPAISDVVGLRRRQPFRRHLYAAHLASGRFAIEEVSGTLFADCRWEVGAHKDQTRMHAFHLGLPQDGAEQSPQDAPNWPICRSYKDGIPYRSSNAEDIGFTESNPLAILSVGSGLVVWSHFFASQRPPYETMIKVGACGSGAFADRHDLVHQTSVLYRVCDLAAQPGEYTAALASDCGLYLMDLSHTSYPIRDYPMGTNELTKATFKDHNIVIGGTRSGKVLLCDIRAPPPPTKGGRTTATRLQHSDAITGLAALPDGNRILVSGMSSMKIYDLRFAPPPTLMCHLPRSNTFMASPAVLDFDVPATRHHRWLGQSFVYDPELDIVLRSSTDDHRNHRAALWSVRTGRLLRGPLNNFCFDASVSCAAIARVRDGPKSILISAGMEIIEWTPQGRGGQGIDAVDDQE